MKILLVGKSATGKDTVANALRDKYGYRRAESYTTRPKRTPDEGGHHFINSAEGYEPIAGVKIQGYDYFLTKEEIENADVIIVEPSGVRAVCEAAPDSTFYLIYLVAEDEDRMNRFVLRDPEHGEETFRERRLDDDLRFVELERLIDNDNEKLDVVNIAAVTKLENHYDEQSLFAILHCIHTIFTRHGNLKSVVRELVDRGAMLCDDCGNMLVQDTDGANTVVGVPEDLFVSVCLASERNRFDIFDIWLSYHDAETD